MAVSKDWMGDAAAEIAYEFLANVVTDDPDADDSRDARQEEAIAAIIAKHCPFARYVAYMRVPVVKDQNEEV